MLEFGLCSEIFFCKGCRKEAIVLFRTKADVDLIHLALRLILRVYSVPVGQLTSYAVIIAILEARNLTFTAEFAWDNVSCSTDGALKPLARGLRPQSTEP